MSENEIKKSDDSEELTFEYQESLDDLIQLSSAEYQTIDDAMQDRISELLADNDIDDDDVIDVYSGVSVSYTIIYKKRKEEENE